MKLTFRDRTGAEHEFDDIQDATVILTEIAVAGEDGPHELQYIFSHEGLVTDVYTSRVSSLDHNPGTACETHQEAVDRLCNLADAESFFGDHGPYDDIDYVVLPSFGSLSWMLGADGLLASYQLVEGLYVAEYYGNCPLLAEDLEEALDESPTTPDSIRLVILEEGGGVRHHVGWFSAPTGWWFCLSGERVDGTKMPGNDLCSITIVNITNWREISDKNKL